jgi:hypothetical protein
MIRDFPEQYGYNSMKEFTVGSITQHNRNGLLWREGSGVDGIKTGHTSTAGLLPAGLGQARRPAFRLDRDGHSFQVAERGLPPARDR